MSNINTYVERPLSKEGPRGVKWEMNSPKFVWEKGKPKMEMGSWGHQLRLGNETWKNTRDFEKFAHRTQHSIIWFLITGGKRS